MRWRCCQVSDFSPEAYAEAYARLSPSRKAHIDRLRREEDRQRSLAGELLIRSMLLEMGITDSTLHRADSGQPYLSGCNLHISISHCGTFVACAISPDPVGIDIERIRPIEARMCRHVCTEEEAAYLCPDALSATGKWDDPQLLRRFFEIWTGKEAWFKKCGTGITDFRSINTLTLPQTIFEHQGHLIRIL